MYVDIHAHYSFYQKDSSLVGKSLLTAHHFNEIDGLMEAEAHPWLYRAIGVHPQDPDPNLLTKIEHILRKDILRYKVDAIGEIGFDLWDGFKSQKKQQIAVFVAQLALAIECNLPIVIHQRKAMHLIFYYYKELKRLPAVIFHAYSGTLQEAISLRKKGINAYFSIGTPILWGSKIAQEIAVKLPLNWIFIETDTPFQPVRGKEYTDWSDLLDVYQSVALHRSLSMEELTVAIDRNFETIFTRSQPS